LFSISRRSTGLNFSEGLGFCFSVLSSHFPTFILVEPDPPPLPFHILSTALSGDIWILCLRSDEPSVRFSYVLFLKRFAPPDSILVYSGLNRLFSVLVVFLFFSLLCPNLFFRKKRRLTPTRPHPFPFPCEHSALFQRLAPLVRQRTGGSEIALRL